MIENSGSLPIKFESKIREYSNLIQSKRVTVNKGDRGLSGDTVYNQGNSRGCQGEAALFYFEPQSPLLFSRAYTKAFLNLSSYFTFGAMVKGYAYPSLIITSFSILPSSRYT